jgi:hypothetical protein
MIEDISNRLLNEFATCLQTNLAGGTGEATPDAPAVAAGQAAAPAPTEAAAAAPAPTEAAADADADAEAAAAIAGVPTEAGAEMGSTLASGEAAAEQVAAAGEASRQAAAAGESAPTSSPAFQPTESEPVEGLSLMASALWGQAKRNPLQVAALVFGFLLALRVLRRRS